MSERPQFAKGSGPWLKKFGGLVDDALEDFEEEMLGEQDAYDEMEDRRIEDEELLNFEYSIIKDRLKETIKDHPIVTKVPAMVRKVKDLNAALYVKDLETCRDYESEILSMIEDGERQARQFYDPIDRGFFSAVKVRCFTGDDFGDLNDLRKQAVTANKNFDLPKLEELHTAFTRLVDRLWNDETTLLARVRVHLDKFDENKLREACEMCRVAGVDVYKVKNSRLDGSKLDTATNDPPTDYTIADNDNCRSHAYARHTGPGIFAARKILTAHPSKVAIFDPPEKLDEVLRNVPTAVDSWKSRGGSGSVEAKVKGAVVYGNLIDGTVYLETCFPHGSDHLQRDVSYALGYRSYEDFRDELGLTK